MAEPGHDLRDYIATRLGHASPATTLSIYSHFVPEADREAADLLGQLAEPGPTS